MSQRKRFFKILGLVFAVLLVLFCISLPLTRPVIEQARVRVIIDPGHGEPDGGAVGTDGTTEQELNLKIAQKTYALFSDGTALLTRNDSSSIYKEGSTIRAKKISDMNERVKIAQRYPDALIVSIHMNTYPNESVHGCQVFYRDSDETSKRIAAALQQSINEKMQPSQPKNIKPIAKNLYLFKNTDNASVLIECGFLTNAGDLKKMKDETYQEALAKLIFESVETEMKKDGSKS